MISILFIALASSKSDRRLDPFQFNLCVWNLDKADEYCDPSHPDHDSTLSDIASVMYSYLSTCDIFVLPGLRFDNTSQLINQKLNDKDFVDFDIYPTGKDRDVTMLTRVDPINITFLPNQLSYPIENSKCNYQGPSGYVDFSKSWYASYQFHDPVPLTHIFSVSLADDTAEQNKGCAIREAQAQSLCEIAKQIPDDEHIYIAGTFNNLQDESLSLLSQCDFFDRSLLKQKANIKTREDSSKKETVWSNSASKKYLDLMKYQNYTKERLWDNEPYPITLMTHQPLSKRWKTFELIFSPSIVLIFISFFIWLLFYSRPSKAEDYQNLD